MKVVEGDVNGEMQGGVMSPGAMAIEGSDLKVNGNVSGGLVSDSSTVTVNGKVAQGGSCHRPAAVCGDRHRSADRKGMAQKNSGK